MCIFPDHGQIQFGVSQHTVNEDAGTYQVSISRTGGSTGTLKVSLRTSDDTASSGSDYDFSSQDFTFSDGDVSIGKIFKTKMFTCL